MLLGIRQCLYHQGENEVLEAGTAEKSGDPYYGVEQRALQHPIPIVEIGIEVRDDDVVRVGSAEEYAEIGHGAEECSADVGVRVFDERLCVLLEEIDEIPLGLDKKHNKTRACPA